jgi:hypothetical protein
LRRWELLLSAVRRHTNCLWGLLYVERWPNTAVQMEDAASCHDSSGRGRHSPYAKGNFTFDRVIYGWGRGLTVLDLGLKR